MKKIFYAIMVIATTSFLFTSCDNDDGIVVYNSNYFNFITIGELIEQDQSGMEIVSDKGNKISVINRMPFNNSVGTRVVAFGIEKSSKKDGDIISYEIEGKEVSKILTKKAVSLTQIAASEELADSIGNDYVFPGSYMSSYIASKYLNINFAYVSQGNGAINFIHLVMDEDSDGVNVVPDANGLLKLTARLSRKALNSDRYNGYVMSSFVSFDIEKYMLITGVKSIEIEVKYQTSGDSSETVTTTWVKDATSDRVERNMINNSTFENRSTSTLFGFEISKDLK